MPTIACTGQSEARGRTRWFRLATAELSTHTPGHTAEARRGRRAPGLLRLTIADATALTQALQEEVALLTPVLSASHPCCPQCQEPLHLADATPLGRRHARGAGRHVPHLRGLLA